MAGAIVYLSSVVLLALNVILFLVAGFPPGDPAVRGYLFGMILVNDLALVVSSILWAVWSFRRGERGLGFLFAANPVIFGAAFVVRSRGLQFPPWAFAAADLYWLQLYLVALLVHSRTLRATPGR